jgi:hypothetical protein
MGQTRNVYKIIVGMPQGRNNLKNVEADGDNIKIDLKEIGWKSGDWFHVPQDRHQWRVLVKTATKLRVQ